MKSIILFLSLSLFTHNFLLAQEWTQSLLQPDCMAHGSASIVVRDLVKDEVVLEYDGQRALPTASIQKILPTAATLKALGPDFRYPTIVGYTGKIAAGSLQGDLIIKGSGDPTLGSDYFEDNITVQQWLDSIVDHLKIHKINTIKGNIIVDDSAVKGQNVPSGWPWADLGNYYGAGHWSINVNNNEYKLIFKQNPSLGRPTTILGYEPALPGFELANEVVSGPANSGDRSYIYASPNGWHGTVRGTIPKGNGTFSIRGSISNPPTYVGRIIENHLSVHNIKVSGELIVTKESHTPTETLYTHWSPPLKDIAQVTNFKSVNLYAEALMKLMCDQPNNSSTFECGRKNMMSFYKSQGVNDDQGFIVDGSGLSPRNASSARLFTDILQTIYKDSIWFSNFEASLPEMGKDGTVKSMLRNKPNDLVIKAKSGFIGRQRSYSGYIFISTNKVYSFCIILDNYSCSSSAMRYRIQNFLLKLPQYLER